MSEIPDLSHLYRRYNLGCGASLYRGYVNVGFWSDLAPGEVYSVDVGDEKRVLCNLDLRAGIPAGDGSLDVVYHCHFLEHLTREEGVRFIDECRRVLAPGGVMRAVVPDLAIWAKAYVERDDFLLDQYRRHVLGDDKVKYPTAASVFMGALHNHEHKMGYDFETLKTLFERAGFVDIKRTFYQESVLPEIAEMELYNLQHTIRAAESLCVECVRAPGDTTPGA